MVQPYHRARAELLEKFEEDYLRRLLAETGGNIVHAAELAGVNRATIYRIAERLGFVTGPDLPSLAEQVEAHAG
ncbi:MAG: helix-turn-helix domain-containing protein [Vicinamibacterales bacterium]